MEGLAGIAGHLFKGYYILYLLFVSFVILTIGRISRWDCATDFARSFTAFRMTSDSESSP